MLVASDELSRSLASRASFLRAASFLRELPVKGDVGPTVTHGERIIAAAFAKRRASQRRARRKTAKTERSFQKSTGDLGASWRFRKATAHPS